MKTIKVIDLLNKIAKGEEVPKRIRYANFIWGYDNQAEDYGTNEDEYYLFESLFCYNNTLAFINEELEIIEEDNKIEKIGARDDTTLYELENYDGMLENALDWNFKVIEDKINILTEALIDVVNELKEDK